ncbi:MAG: NADH-quinone oxidoreductase subunit, partial [Solirubrobacteraceae bacterium]|nr:NADH-quinone oxidoreductase subunit [Solirubrobacteraceae bacterium]
MKGPHIDWAALSPLVALTVGACVVLLGGLLRPAFVRRALVPGATGATLAVAVALGIWQWGENKTVVAGAIAIDDLTLSLLMIFAVAAAGATMLSARSLAAAEAGHGEYHALLLLAVLGMVVLAGAVNLVSLFIGFELLSIPLYVLCATELRREHSLESGLKYLIIGSLGSAVLLYGLALLYGATGSTDFATIAAAVGDVRDDPLFLTSLALIVTGLA